MKEQVVTDFNVWNSNYTKQKIAQGGWSIKSLMEQRQNLYLVNGF